MQPLSVVQNLTSRAPTPSAAELAAAYRECSVIAKRHARNFYYAFLTLPKEQRLAMCALYSFMRKTDDLSDEDSPVEEKHVALKNWRATLHDVLERRKPQERWWLALEDTVRKFDIPPVHLETVIDGVESDLTVSRYRTFADLYDYCYHVASAVGLCCIRIWGVRDRRADIYAEWLGIAFQLTNVIRDIAEDSQRGRIYLPLDVLHRHGLSESDLGATIDTSPSKVAAWKNLIRQEAARAADYYERAKPLKRYLNGSACSVHRVLVDIYRSVLTKIETQPEAVLTKRLSLSPLYKSFVLARGIAGRMLIDGNGVAAPPPLNPCSLHDEELRI